jgi:hypothetical protein
MSQGIYLLKFKGTDKVYVGQSVNIEYRYKKHIQSLKRGSSPYKLQQAYSLYGPPELEILISTEDSSLLNTLENEAIEIFNSVANGFNTAELADLHGEGELNPASKYSNDKIEEVFNLLLDLSKRYKDIEKETGVSISTVRHIANLEAHTWLSIKYPEEYALLKSYKGKIRQQNTNSASQRGISYPTIISPEGLEYEVSNAADFARKHGLDSSTLVKVLKRRPKYISHKGWKLK